MSRADEENYQRLEGAYQAAMQMLDRKMKAIVDCQNLQLQQNLIHEARQDAGDVSSALENLESELRHMPYALRTRAQKAASQHTAELDKATSQLKRYEHSLSQGQLAGSNHLDRVNRLGAEDQSRYLDQRQQLLMGAQIVNESDDSLTRTQRLLLETQEVGAATSMQLVQQREQFQGQLQSIHQTDDFLSRSKRTLQRMHKRIVTNKIIQGAIIVVEAGAVGLIIYLKYYS